MTVSYTPLDVYKRQAVLTAGLAVSSLVGCQNNYSETTASASEQIADNSSEAVLEETSKKVSEDLSGSITLYTSQPEEDIQVMIDGFNKKWPDIQVDVFRSGTEAVSYTHLDVYKRQN